MSAAPTPAARAVIDAHLRAYSAFLATLTTPEVDAIRDLFLESNRAGAVVLPSNADLTWGHYDSGNYRSISHTLRAEYDPESTDWVDAELPDYLVGTYLQTPYCPRGGEKAGVWYGAETRLGDDGNHWERRIWAVVNDFGDLVEVQR